MYISYANLWKLLIDKGITKTELMELTKMSSRTLAKLSKNQNVTTQTLLSICEALSCNINDIMEICEGNEQLSFYRSFKQNRTLLEKGEACSIYSLNYKEKDYIIKITNKKATKHTIICCEEKGVIWEQLYPLGFSPAKETVFISKKAFAQDGKIGVLVISGNPLSIKGLDENGYACSRGRAKKDDIYIMSSAAFKLFEPN